MARVKLFLIAAALMLMLSASNEVQAQQGGHWGPSFPLPGGMIGTTLIMPDMTPVLCVDRDADGTIDY